jgi:hypothetical protein
MTIGAAPSAHPPRALVDAILEFSRAKRWKQAVQEWELDHIYVIHPDEELGFCLCGHRIREVCVIANDTTECTTEVGNCCINQFFGIPTEILFSAFRRVLRNVESSLGAAAICYAHDHGWINDWEREFCRNISRRRRLSEKQMAVRLKINRRVIARLSRAH